MGSDTARSLPDELRRQLPVGGDLRRSKSSFAIDLVIAFASGAQGPEPDAARSASTATLANSVRIPSGSMTTTSMPNDLTYTRNLSLTASRATLAPCFHARRGPAMQLLTEEVSTIVPERLSRIQGKTRCAMRSAPNAFSSNCRRLTSIGTYSMSPYGP